MDFRFSNETDKIIHRYIFGSNIFPLEINQWAKVRDQWRRSILQSRKILKVEDEVWATRSWSMLDVVEAVSATSTGSLIKSV